MKIQRKTCIFCAKGKSFKSREHVFPRWLLENLNYKNNPQPFFSTEFNTITDNFVDSTSNEFAKFNFDNFLSPYICDDCNKGWMSNLECKIKPLILPLINGEKKLEDLSKVEKRMIARWSVKTTCVIESVNFSKSSYISFDPKIIKDRQTLPPGWAVFAFTHESTNTLTWFSNNVWFIEGFLTDDLRTKCEGYKKIIFQLKNLVIATIFIGDERLKLKAVKKTHYPIDINLNYEWVTKPVAPSFNSYKGVIENSSDDLMFRFLGAFSLSII